MTSSFFAYVWFTTLRSSIFATTTYLTQAILAQYRKRSNKKNRAKFDSALLILKSKLNGK